MPLPLIIGGIAVATGVAGIGSAIYGGVKMKKANDSMKAAKEKQEKAIALFEERNRKAMELMDSIGRLELGILSSFEKFSDIIEKIQGRPEFVAHKREDVSLPKYEAEELKKVSAGAGILLGGLGGAAVGTASGFAAAGATTSAVMALGTASTGAAIASLSGAAATNATLAALGGGSIAAGGGGMALGATVLGGATLGVGLLVGGIIFSIVGSSLSDKADEAYSQAQRTEREVNRIIEYFDELDLAARPFKAALTRIESQYRRRLAALDYIVNSERKVRWSEFTDREKQMTENTILLVGLLYKMCNIKLALKSQNGDGLNTVNKKEIRSAVEEADKISAEVKRSA